MPEVRLGASTSIPRYLRYVRSCSKSGRIADMPVFQVRAKCGHRASNRAVPGHVRMDPTSLFHRLLAAAVSNSCVIKFLVEDARHIGRTQRGV